MERQAREREINLKIIKDTITNQQQIVPEPKGLKIAQSKYYDKENNKDYLIRSLGKINKNTETFFISNVSEETKTT